MKCAPQDQMDLAMKELDKITVSDLEPAKPSDLVQDPLRIPVLKEKSWGEYANARDMVFASASPWFFTTENAGYVPKYGLRSPTILIQGKLYLESEERPNDIKAILAHEFGHHLDPVKSGSYSYPEVAKCYGGVMACLKAKNKIHSQDFQMGETLSDVYSAEYMASELEKLPAQERRAALPSYIYSFCRWENEAQNRKAEMFSEKEYGVSMNDVHPDIMIRLNQTIGGNKKLRQALGCSLSSEKVPVCELPGGMAQ